MRERDPGIDTPESFYIVMISDDLKPCPWCAVVPKATSEGGVGSKYVNGSIFWTVDCVNPECLMQPIMENFTHTKEQAIKAWNDRKQPDA